SSGKIKIEGVEDEKSYLGNLKARELVDLERPKILNRLSALDGRLAARKQETYGKALLELDTASRQYEDGKFSLKEYVKYLIRHAPVKLAAGYPNLELLSELIRTEDSLAVKAVMSEREGLVRALGEKLDKASLAMLAQSSLNFRLGKLSAW